MITRKLSMCKFDVQLFLSFANQPPQQRTQSSISHLRLPISLWLMGRTKK